MLPHEMQAREEEANAIAMYVISLVDGHLNEGMPGALRRMGPAFRDEVARRAGQRTPSDRTWERVAEIVGKRVELRYMEPISADRFVRRRAEAAPSRWLVSGRGGT